MFTAKQSAKFKKEVGKRLRAEIEGIYGNRREFVFAKQIGISQGSLSDILNGKSSPSAETLMRIATHTTIGVTWLLIGLK